MRAYYLSLFVLLMVSNNDNIQGFSILRGRMIHVRKRMFFSMDSQNDISDIISKYPAEVSKMIVRERLQAYENLLKEKEREISRILNEKEREKEKEIARMQSTYENFLNEKDKVYQNILHDKENDKEKEVALRTENAKLKLDFVTMQLMMQKGLMTARGIMERILREAHAVIKRSDKDKFNATSVIKQLSDLENDATQLEALGKTDAGKLVVNLLKWRVECKVNLQTLYNTLSEQIHGESWHGQSVLLKSKFLKKEEKCLLLEVAKNYNLDVTEDLEGPI